MATIKKSVTLTQYSTNAGLGINPIRYRVDQAVNILDPVVGKYLETQEVEHLIEDGVKVTIKPIK